MDPIIKYLRDHKGCGRMKEFRASGFQTRDIRNRVVDGRLVKVNVGLYRLAEIMPGEATGMVEICLAVPKVGIEHHETRAGQIRIYGPHKTVCDLFGMTLHKSLEAYTFLENCHDNFTGIWKLQGSATSRAN